MYETPNKALKSARELELSADRFGMVAQHKWRSVLSAVVREFTSRYDATAPWLWDSLSGESSSARVSNPLEIVRGVAAPTEPVWLLLDDFDSTKMEGQYWVFEGDLDAVVDVLENMQRLEYYIVHRKFEWLLVENHHAVLIGVGQAARAMVATAAGVGSKALLR